MVSTAAFHARARGSVPDLGGLKKNKKMFLPHPRVKVSIVGSLHDREFACSASDRQGRISNPVSGVQCHLTHLTILRRFSWPSSAYVHKCGLKPDLYHFPIYIDLFPDNMLGLNKSQITYIFSHLKLCVTLATHNFK